MAPLKRALVVEKFIDIILIFRPYFRQLPTYLYFPLLLVFFVVRYMKEGNTTSVVTQILSAIVILTGQVLNHNNVFYAGIFLALISYILEPTVYHLPQISHKLSIKQHTDKTKVKDLYWIQCFKIDETKAFKNYEIPWAKTIEYQRMATHMQIKGRFLESIFRFINSIPAKIKIKLAEGEEKVQNNDIVLFSHGRGATPFMYSLIIRQLSKKHKVIAPQHNQVQKTQYTDMKVLKKFRQREVVSRAVDLEYLALNKVQSDQNIILVGHSYGCATVLQAYQDIQVKKKVSKIILLDPWLFPLTQEVFQNPINCPVLILANENFLKMQDIHTRMNRFVQIHKNITYICWKDGDHLHQTDMGFITGSSLRKIKNSQLSDVMQQMNMEAMFMFLDEEPKEKIQEKFSDWNVTIDYKPKSWVKPLNF